MQMILFESCGDLGEGGRFLVDLTRGLLARGWEVTAVLGEEGRLGDTLRELGVAVTVIALPRWAYGGGPMVWSPGLTAVLRLARHLRRLGGPLLYANGAAGALLGGAAARLAGGQICWRALTTSDETGAPARWARWLGARMLPRTPAIHLADWRCLDPPRRKRGATPVVGLLGPWLPRLGAETLLQAFRLLHAAGRQGRLRLGSTGRGDERLLAMLHGAIRAQGLTAYVTIEERVDDPGVFLAGCDLIAIPALNEDTGRVALEAAALGRPVVASRVPGLEALITDGHTGLLVPPGDPRALADALELLLASPALRAEMGRQARVRAEERYGVGTVIDALEALLPAAARPGVSQ